MEKKFKYLKELINKNQTGITLIEILVALVISTIVIAGLYVAYSFITKQFLQQQILIMLTFSLHDLKWSNSVLQGISVKMGYATAE